MSNRTDRQFSLRFSLGSAFAGIALLTAALLGLATYLSLSSFIRDGIRDRLNNVVSISALQIDGEMHNAIQTAADEQKPEYLSLKKTLQDIRDQSRDIRFVYTMRKNAEGKLVFAVDAEANPEVMSHVGDSYDKVTPEMLAAFEEPYGPHAEKVFGSDKWGVWLSCYAPFFTKDKKVAGILGMDMSAAKVLAYERKSLLTIVLVSLSASVLVAGLGLYFSSRLTRPLTLLQEDMQKVQAFDLDSNVQIASRVTEIRGMKVAVANMKNGLRSFKKYVPAQLVADLIRLQKEAVLQAEKKDITVFFSDIADFTTISERTPPEQLAECLGVYFRGMTETVLRNQGTVDKFIGDAIMAFWNAPNPVEDHALMACRSALQCQRFLSELSENWKGTGNPPLVTRIGINSGEAIVGNMGYEERMSYTAIGDVVNLASRIEGLNKYYGTSIIMGEKVFDQVKEKVVARLVDIVAVKGKTIGIRIYELMAEKDAADKEVLVLASLCNEALDHYLHRRWAVAAHILAECRKNQSVAKSCKLIEDRCHAFKTDPPPEDWSGVFVMSDK